MDELTIELRSLLVDVAPSLNVGFDENAHLYNELGLPSVAAMELLLRLEERYRISIPDDEFIEATSLRALHSLVTHLKAA
jgi:acyl carrier protein